MTVIEYDCLDVKILAAVIFEMRLSSLWQEGSRFHNHLRANFKYSIAVVCFLFILSLSSRHDLFIFFRFCMWVHLPADKHASVFNLCCAVLWIWSAYIWCVQPAVCWLIHSCLSTSPVYLDLKLYTVISTKTLLHAISPHASFEKENQTIIGY